MILSEPAGARVYIEGQYVGTTPVTVTLKKQTHAFRLEKDGYESLSDYLSVVLRGAGELTARLLGAYWIFADDTKYTFKDSYSFRLRPLERAPHDAEDPLHTR